MRLRIRFAVLMVMGLCVESDTARSRETLARIASGTWVREVGGKIGPKARPLGVVALDDGGGVAASGEMGSALGKLFAIRFDSTGGIVWQTSFPDLSRQDRARAFCRSDDGGYFLCGHLRRAGVPRGSDVYVRKLDGMGTLLWQRYLGETSDDSALAFEAVQGGGCVVVGNEFSPWIAEVDSSGDIIWQEALKLQAPATDRIQSIRQVADGGFLLAGSVGSPRGGSSDAWVVKLDSKGRIRWQTAYGGIGYDAAIDIVPAADGGCHVLAATNSFGAGQTDLWLLRLGAQGAVRWQVAIGGESSEYADSISVGVENQILLTGWSASHGLSLGGSPSSILVAVGAGGAVQWQRALSGYRARVAPMADEGLLAASISGAGNLLLHRLTQMGQHQDECAILGKDIAMSVVHTTADVVSTRARTGVSSVESFALHEPPVAVYAHSTEFCRYPDITGHWSGVRWDGSTLRGVLTCRNEGEVTAKWVQIQVSLSSDPVLDSEDRLVANVVLEQLRPGTERDVTTDLLHPLPTEHYIIGSTDAYDILRESDEANNVDAAQFR